MGLFTCTIYAMTRPDQYRYITFTYDTNAAIKSAAARLAP
jgi:hypothetical protein